MELLLRLVNSFPILAVDDEDETLSAGVVMSPQGPNFVLTAHVPHVELDILVCYCLDVESDCDTRGRISICWESTKSEDCVCPIGRVDRM